MDQTVTNRRIVLAIAVSAAGGMVVAAPSPTGARTIDIALMLIAGTASVWCAASAPWWAIALGAAHLASATGSRVTFHRCLPEDTAMVGEPQVTP